MQDIALEGYDLTGAQYRYAADLRYVGQAYELTIPADVLDFSEMAEVFHREHERTYGHRSWEDHVQVVNARLTVRMANDRPVQKFQKPLPIVRRDRAVQFDGEKTMATIPVIGRDDLDHNPRRGPFVIEEFDCTCVVPPNNTARIDETGNIDIILEAA